VALDPHQLIAAIVDAAEPVGPGAAGLPATPCADGSRATLGDEAGDADREDGPAGDYAGAEAGPSDSAQDQVDPEVVARCARLDHSDTDNGRRLIEHFGADLVVLEQEGARNLDYLAWAGTHWDMIGGNDAALRVAQRIGGRIALEADYLARTAQEARAIEEGETAAAAFSEMVAAQARSGETWSEDERKRARDLNGQVEAGKAARAALDKRKVARRKFAISSKNKARLEAMLACAAPHLTRKPDGFNADPFLFATKGHTVRLVRRRVRERDDECPDPDVDRYVERVEVRVEAVEGHRRADYVTNLVPVAYDPSATCDKWQAFLAEFLPIEQVRRCVQVLTGLGLLGITVQKLPFHYGAGANGKSVFLETVVRVLGPLAVGLPAESITGNTERGAGQASADLARLYGKRFLRVLELPADKPLHEDLVKKLTGGERIPVRSLFKSYFEFAPVFIGHMSGNGYPRIDGTDNGIWRRMVVIHWPVQIPEDRQRDFEDVLADFVPEYPGILNWMIEGALIYLREGLDLPPEVRKATQDYRDEMDPIGEFCRDCVEAVDGASETARAMYEAYVSWCLANAKKPVFETRFGRVMKARFRRDDGRIRRYLDCRLHDVPARPDPARNPVGD
jgi:putative DNA primase/helicase